MAATVAFSEKGQKKYFQVAFSLAAASCSQTVANAQASSKACFNAILTGFSMGIYL